MNGIETYIVWESFYNNITIMSFKIKLKIGV